MASFRVGRQANPSFGSGPSTQDIAVIHEAPLNPLYPEFGVKFDGSTDDTAAWQRLIAALPSRGAEIYVPPLGVSLISGQLVFPVNSIDLVVRGGGSQHQGASGCTLLSTYTGSGAVVTANAARGFRWEGVSIQNSQAAFTGTLLDLSRGAGNGDTTMFIVRNCRLYNLPQVGATARGLKLTKATVGDVEGVYFLGGGYGVEGLLASSDYTNSVTVGTNCYFQQQELACIHNLGDQCRVREATFEPLRNGNAGAYLQDASLAPGSNTLDWIDNWTGDGNGSGTWIIFNGSRLTLRGGRISQAATGIQLNGTTRQMVIATYFAGNTTDIDLNSQIVDFLDTRGTIFGDPTTTFVAGSSGNLAVMGGGGINPTFDAVSVNLSGTQSIPTATATAMSWSAMNFNTHAAAPQWVIGNPTRLTAQMPGLFRIYACIAFDNASTVGARAVWFRVNGTTWLSGTQVQAATSGRTDICAATSWPLRPGDYVECYVNQNSGGALNVNTSDAALGIQTTFGMERLS